MKSGALSSEYLESEIFCPKDGQFLLTSHPQFCADPCVILISFVDAVSGLAAG
jgi:hypothetical protein